MAVFCGSILRDVSAKIDAQVSGIVGNALKIAEETIKKHRKALDAIAVELVRVETLERKEFNDLLIANGIVPKKEEELAVSVSAE